MATTPANTSDSLREALTAALAPAFVLGDEMGGGGMSRVFAARDPSLGRDVVVKVLHPELAGTVNADRFVREIQMVARLQHPLIVPVLAAGEAMGLPFFTMPFVHGRSLRARLDDTRNVLIPIDEAASILRDVARALAFAHEHGIVHRDIKPDNVLLASGTAAVADFGIAKALATSRLHAANDAGGTGSGLTLMGASIGTPLYMSPEQVVGDPSIDHRADIYSWGVLAYELLAGRPPFAHASMQKLLAAHIAETPSPIADHRPDCPDALATLVMDALAKDPDDRPQSAGDVGRRLSDRGAPSTASRAALADPLDEARAAFERRDWSAAAARLAAADAAHPLGAEELEMLGEAQLAGGNFDAAERARERAYTAYVAADALQAAARMACAMALEHVVRGRAPVAMGWMETAANALREQPECDAHGFLTWIKSQATLVFQGDAGGGLALAEEVIAIGRRLGDVDIEMMGLATAGRALVRLGRGDDGVQQGLAYLDTAMASATTGILKPNTAKYIVCNLLCGCHELGDYRRASEWCDAADRSTARLSLVPAAGDCHVHRATLLRVRGDWAGAEVLALQGMEELSAEAFHSGFALYELGEVRLLRGDFTGAASAFQDAQERGHSGQPGLARLALARGKIAAARSMIDAALEDARTPLIRAGLLPAAIDAAIAASDLVHARAAASELSEIARAYGTPALLAAEASANGAVALATGDADPVPHLRRALKEWRELRMPYEAARARVGLAAAYKAAGKVDLAETELAAARGVFERLGAAPDMARINAAKE